MLYLLLAAGLIVIACFCMVFGLDGKTKAMLRRDLLIAGAICIFLCAICVYFILKNPLLI